MSFLHIRGYSVDVAKTFGILSSVLLSCINDKIFFDASDSSTTSTALTRNDIYNMTGMEESKQIDVENNLISIGVLLVQPFKNVKDKSYYSINYKKLYELMSSPSFASIIQEDKKVVQKRNINTRANQIKALKSLCCVDNQSYKQLLCDWVDSIYASPKGFISPQSMKLTIEELSKFTDDDRCAIMRIAIKNGWKDISWAINRFSTACGKRDDYRFCDYDSIKSDGSNIVSEEF